MARFLLGPLYDVNADGQVDDADYLIGSRVIKPEIRFDDRPENLDQQGPVDGEELLIIQQSYGVDVQGDVNNGWFTNGIDFLAWQKAFTPFEVADINLIGWSTNCDLGILDSIRWVYGDLRRGLRRG